MKKPIKKIIKNTFVTIMISSLVSVIGCLIVYHLLPQYLCYVVQDVHCSNLYQSKRLLVENSEYMEYFVPQQYSYLKGIRLHTEKEIDDKGEREDVLSACINLIDGSGDRIMIDKKMQFDAQGGFIEFPVEKWVEPGEKYKFIVTLSGGNGLYITSGPGDIGPAEHQKLEINGEKVEDALYVEYVYGGYSKKMLLFWFLIFFTISCILLEETLPFLKRKADLKI